MKRLFCWRCKKVDVAVYGVPCDRCREILEAAYDRRRARKGGKLLFIPDDWDGIATIDCSHCGEPFDAPFLAKQSVGEVCDNCKRKAAGEWNDQHRGTARRERVGLDEVRINVASI
jgi:formylmethanofuran dehydrogenase subunit E